MSITLIHSEEFCLWTKKALLGRFTVQKSYKVEFPAILQKKPRKTAVKIFELSDCRIGIWPRTQADVKQKRRKGKSWDPSDWTAN